MIPILLQWQYKRRHQAPTSAVAWSSTSRNRRSENVRVHAVVIAELELGNIEARLTPKAWRRPLGQSRRRRDCHGPPICRHVSDWLFSPPPYHAGSQVFRCRLTRSMGFDGGHRLKREPMLAAISTVICLTKTPRARARKRTPEDRRADTTWRTCRPSLGAWWASLLALRLDR